jgi:hypothetical protein
MMIDTATVNVAGRPAARAVHFAKRVNNDFRFVDSIANASDFSRV